MSLALCLYAAAAAVTASCNDGGGKNQLDIPAGDDGGGTLDATGDSSHGGGGGGDAGDASSDALADGDDSGDQPQDSGNQTLDWYGDWTPPLELGQDGGPEADTSTGDDAASADGEPEDAFFPDYKPPPD